MVLISGFHLRNELISQGYAAIHSSDFPNIPPTTTAIITLWVEEGVGLYYQIAVFLRNVCIEGQCSYLQRLILAGDGIHLLRGYALAQFLEELADIKAEIGTDSVLVLFGAPQR